MLDNALPPRSSPGVSVAGGRQRRPLIEYFAVNTNGRSSQRNGEIAIELVSIPVCMMSGATTESMIGNNRTTMPNIKQEVDNPSTPTQNYQSICTKLDIPPDYGDSGGSPESPEMHHCSSTTQPLGATDDGVKEEDMMPRRLCLVCGDVASGFHYGVASCEACKAFFKRTIQASNFTGNIEYTCPANGECEINKRRRKACQACRFQKCLRQGMLKEGVRLDRVRGGRQKYRRSTDPYTPVKSTTLEANVVASAAPTETINNKMVEALTACEPDMLQVSNISHTLETDQRVLGQLSDLYDRELVGIIGWAKQIPGFSSLALNDQIRLLQSTWAEILTFTLAWRSTPNSGRLRFAQDFTLDERLAHECHCMDLYTHIRFMEICFHVLDDFNVSSSSIPRNVRIDVLRDCSHLSSLLAIAYCTRFLIGSRLSLSFFKQCIQIVERIQRLGLTREEYYMLKALILANSDARSDEPQALYRFRDTILNSLSDCVAVVRPGQALRATQNMFLVLPSLRQADGIVRRFWSSVFKTGKVPMNKLFVEMLEAVCY
ncbi:steroid hormone receptor ERR1 isoform X3 [Harpegnathos saltator]|uniref:steroid hormone receptor ERR1 isoform X3 n=2 Tax=Harpegnathos saltator TaxID=610380 RepID=UPI000DBEE391|nr:steroid hormone receptor ERR1 isoform X3 [Harpegnathos saltator]